MMMTATHSYTTTSKYSLVSEYTVNKPMISSWRATVRSISTHFKITIRYYPSMSWLNHELLS
jgi:hypothetical protein